MSEQAETEFEKSELSVRHFLKEKSLKTIISV